MKIPNFKYCETTGKYQANHALSDKQIIKAAKKILTARVCKGKKIDNLQLIIDYLTTFFYEDNVEKFVCLFADSKKRLITIECLFKGTIDHAVIHPREVIRRCLELNASFIIFSHNHISGDPSPSKNDISTTELLKCAVYYANVRVMDHIIIGGSNAYSFSEEGLIL